MPFRFSRKWNRQTILNLGIPYLSTINNFLHYTNLDNVPIYSLFSARLQNKALILIYTSNIYFCCMFFFSISPVWFIYTVIYLLPIYRYSQAYPFIIYNCFWETVVRSIFFSRYQEECNMPNISVSFSCRHIINNSVEILDNKNLNYSDNLIITLIKNLPSIFLIT